MPSGLQSPCRDCSKKKGNGRRCRRNCEILSEFQDQSLKRIETMIAVDVTLTYPIRL